MDMQYKSRLEEIGLSISNLELTSNDHQDISCLLCGDIFTATPKSKLANFKKHGYKGCPKCVKAQLNEDPRSNMESDLIKMGFILLNRPVHMTRLSDITVINNNCGCKRSWVTKPAHLLSGRSFCRPCNDDKKRMRFDSLNQERKVDDDGTLAWYRSEARRLTEKTYRENISILNPNNYQRARSGTPDGYHLDHIVPIIVCYRNKIPVELCASLDNLQLVHYSVNAKKWSKPIGKIPKKLSVFLTKRTELLDRIVDRLDAESIVWEVETTGDFDILIENTLAIKVVDFLNHMENSLKSKRFLADLVDNSPYAKNFIVFENEVKENQKFEVLINRIKNAIAHQTIKKVFARKCISQFIDAETSKKFINGTHMQGHSRADIHTGLYYGTELVAVMSFSKARAFMKKKAEPGVLEIVRYATRPGYSVIGGASKLLNYLIKQMPDIVKVFSFSDRRWGAGNVYTKIGMEFIHNTKPNYWYIIDGKPVHRFGYAKHTLQKKFPHKYDDSKSEYANMLSFGFDRVWDCGSSLFELYIPQSYK